MACGARCNRARTATAWPAPAPARATPRCKSARRRRCRQPRPCRPRDPHRPAMADARGRNYRRRCRPSHSRRGRGNRPHPATRSKTRLRSRRLVPAARPSSECAGCGRWRAAAGRGNRACRPTGRRARRPRRSPSYCRATRALPAGSRWRSRRHSSASSTGRRRNDWRIAPSAAPARRGTAHPPGRSGRGAGCRR